MARPLCAAGGPPVADRQELNRFVLLTGEHDINRAQTRAIYEQDYLEDRFKHVHYLEVPGMGQAVPPVEWFDKGVGLLDGDTPVTPGSGP